MNAWFLFVGFLIALWFGGCATPGAGRPPVRVATASPRPYGTTRITVPVPRPRDMSVGATSSGLRPLSDRERRLRR